MLRRTPRQLSMKNSFFIKSFIRYFVLMMVPILIVGPYSIYQSNKKIQSNIRKNNWNLLYQVEVNMDSLFQIIDNVSFYFSKNPSIVVKLKDALRTTPLSLNSIRSIETLTSYLQNLTNTNPYVYSAYVYYENENNRFLTSHYGLKNIDTFFDSSWLNTYQNSSEDIWFEIRELKPYPFSNPIPVITIYKKLYSPLSSNLSDGVLAIQFDINSLKDYFSTLSLYHNQTISLIADNGNVILQNNTEDITNIWLYLQTLNLSAKDAISIPVRFNNESYIASILTSNRDESWNYISLIPYRDLYQESRTLKNAILSLTCIAFIISIICAYFSARKDYKRLENILDIFNDATNTNFTYQPMPNRSLDPYGYITQNLLRMFIKNDYLTMQISQKKYKMKLLEMQALQHQINPHFLFNTLHTIYWETFSLTGKPNTSTQMLADLAEILEYSLSNPQEQVSLQEEINYLKHYLDIQSIRYIDKFKVIWEVDNEATIHPTLKMIFQPLIENAIYHGIKEKEVNCTIKIKAYYRYSHIAIHIIDSGNGIPMKKLKEIQKSLSIKTEPELESHIGLLNTHRRLVLAYGQEYGIKIMSKYTVGTVISFNIPITEQSSLP